MTEGFRVKRVFHERLQEVRQALQAAGLQAFLLPVTDEYQGEYSPAYLRRVTWLTGFDGSAGMAVILESKAALLVDGRYTLQASREVNAEDYAILNSADVSPDAYLAEQLTSGARVGYDPKLHTRRDIESFEKKLNRKNIALTPLPTNPVDALWRDRPEEPCAPIVLHPIEYAGEEMEKKCARMAQTLRKENVDACVITLPENICWLFNIRGGDIPYNPLPLCFAVLMRDGHAHLFLHPQKVGDDVLAALQRQVTFHEPETLEHFLSRLGAEMKRVGYDPEHSAIWFAQTLTRSGAEVVPMHDPCILAKARKNQTEIDGMRRAHVLDGAAVTRFLSWFDRLEPDETVTELDVMARLAKCREKNENYFGPSFTTIAGSGPNAAIVHYRASETTSRVIQASDILLLDSGGQYPFGTTDITRTLARGEVSAEFKDRFTRVLKGHIALAQAVFPAGTTGAQLDALARRPLWEAGLDFDHGTGHGVGAYLCVHEGPQRIGKRGSTVALEPGMILSNEPGYYEEGAYGIRIENLVLVVEKETVRGRKFLGFETITRAPIDPRLVQLSLLTDADRAWLNTYHQRVMDDLAPHLDPSEREWLQGYCRAV